MTEVPRRSTRRPRSLTAEQLGRENTVLAAEPARVNAWVLWEDGVEELVPAEAVAWTQRAVKVRWGVPPHQQESWVWAGAVTRS